MSGVPDGEQLTEFAQSTHKDWGTTTAEETIRIRREEDTQAASKVGAKAVHFDFLDCIYRRGKNGEGLYNEAVFIPPHAEDFDLPAQIAQTMVAWLKADDIVVSQLAIGRHVDHILVRKAAEMLKRPLFFDEDIPYLLDYPEELSPNTVGMKDSLQPISEAGFETWIEAIKDYATQLGGLFESTDSIRERMQTYWLERHGIQFWSF